MFTDNVQVSQLPIPRCLYLHAHSELFHEADHDQCCARTSVKYTLSLGAFRQKHG